MVTKTRVSLADYLALKECKPYLELIDGEVVQKSMAGLKHSRLVGRLMYLLIGYLDRTGEGFADTELRHLERAAEWVFLPDVSVTLKARLPTPSTQLPDPVEVLQTWPSRCYHRMISLGA